MFRWDARLWFSRCVASKARAADDVHRAIALEDRHSGERRNPASVDFLDENKSWIPAFAGTMICDVRRDDALWCSLGQRVRVVAGSVNEGLSWDDALWLSPG